MSSKVLKATFQFSFKVTIDHIPECLLNVLTVTYQPSDPEMGIFCGPCPLFEQI